MSNKILITYYSHSGNTSEVARLIHEALGGTLFEIEPAADYPRAYNTVVEQAKKEIQAGYLPPLKSEPDQLESYDTIFVGTPNWWSTVAPPIATFLSKHDLSGKTIVPFCTHGGGGLGKIEKHIANLCPNSTVLSSFVVYGGRSVNLKQEISAWLDKIGFH
ncbi:MAG: hypothetical protein JW750_01750 [Anaerolineaceae bacterium]|nr:hypothetical protein [Anaerolineaceae bacterium]